MSYDLDTILNMRDIFDRGIGFEARSTGQSGKKVH